MVNKEKLHIEKQEKKEEQRWLKSIQNQFKKLITD